MNLPIKMLTGCEDLIPKKAHADDACYDVYSSIDITVPANSCAIVPTGLCMDIPNGFEVVFRGRSGMAAKHSVFAHMGTIDTGYIDECKVILYNLSNIPYKISRGDRIAQFKLQIVLPTELVPVEDFNTASRGGGFGSSGK